VSPENTEQRKLAAIMFTDMVGYSALSQRDDKLALELLEEHRQLLREIFPRFNGTEIKTIGDAFLIEFNSALEAAQCAIEIQRTLAKRNHDVTAERTIELKIGLHIGDVVHRGGDVLWRRSEHRLANRAAGGRGRDLRVDGRGAADS
jgi:adenylate cyclase